MKNLDPVELLKNDAASNARDWLKETSIVSYGVVTEVTAKNVVKVEQLVRNGIARKIVLVVLVSTKSSLFESSSEAAVGDLVKLTFLDKYNRSMFDNAIARHDLTKDWGIQDPQAVGYNKSAAIGELVGPFEGLAETIVRHYLDAGVPATFLRSRAKLTSIFRREVTVMFDSVPDTALVDRLVHYIFGQHSPHLVEHWAKVTRKHGFAVKPDNSLETVDASVSEVYSTMAPISKDIRGTQTVVVGKGTDPAGDPMGSSVDTHAPVSITLGADADITLTSESGATIHFDKPFTLTSDKKITIDGQDAVEILAANAKLVKIGNNLDTISTLLDSIAGTLSGTMPVIVSGGSGAPAVGAPNPAFVSAVNAWKARVDAVFN